MENFDDNNKKDRQIDDLRNKLNGNDDIQTPEEQAQNVKQRYESTQDYIKNNKDSIDDQMLQNLQNKQQNRKIQIDNLKNY